DRPAFDTFLRLSDWLFATTGKTHAISLSALAELLLNFMTGELKFDPAEVAEVIGGDYRRAGRSDRPKILRPFVAAADTRTLVSHPGRAKRQSRHAGA